VFARREARGRSPRYEQLAESVADDPVVLSFLEELPRGKRQPNLLFAAARFLLGEPPDAGSLRTLVTSRRADLTAEILARRTQTNEPLRCATLLPALAAVPGPLALIEVGASAGLTLLPDRYSYDYAGHLIRGTDPLAPVLRCEPRGPVPLPREVPKVAWRTGLDLNPLDVTSDDGTRWLECLMWPGETDRAERLAEAIATARRDPPTVFRGDLLADITGLVRSAPGGCTLVVYHSAVLAYVDEAVRREFAAVLRDLGVVWLSNEAPGVVPCGRVGGDDEFVLIRDGATALARTDPHGAWVRWLQLQELSHGLPAVLVVPAHGHDLGRLDHRPPGLSFHPDQAVRADFHARQLVVLGRGEPHLATPAEDKQDGPRLADEGLEQVTDRLAGHEPPPARHHAPPAAPASAARPQRCPIAG